MRVSAERVLERAGPVNDPLLLLLLHGGFCPVETSTA
jgi:hypothetical protein